MTVLLSWGAGRYNAQLASEVSFIYAELAQHHAVLLRKLRTRFLG